MTRKMSVPSRVSTLALAVALAAGPTPAVAQSFQGTGSFANGTGSISTTSGGTPAQNTTSISITSSQAVIDWTPTDNAVGNFGAIAFQYEGTTATFSSAADFAVLNRINVADQTRILAMDGNISSLVNGVTGGAVYFYSPSGIVIGPHAVINVGSLVLTSRPVTVDGQGNFINNGVVEFGVAPDPFGNSVNPNAAINTVSDVNGTAQINSSGAGSYVALVAPTILHQGDIRTDGTAALVAAEAATITFSPDPGLFNIQVDVGTDAATGIHVDGGTISRNNLTEGLFDHRAYLVAVAKNDAVTMLINNGASVGFDTATSATVEDNVVVLSGGYDVSGGDHSTYSGVSQVDLTITNASLSTNVDAKFTGGVAINSGEGALSFGGDLTAIGGAKTTTGGSVLIDGLNGNSLTIAGDLHARAFRDNGDGSETGLITRLGAQGGSTVTIGGDVNLDSDSFGANAADNGLNAGNATGGNAQINIGANSTLHIVGSALVHADGYGGNQFFGDAAAGNGTGGQALVMAINGGATVTIDGFVSVSAQGFGGSTGECSSCNITGGNGTGGNASVQTNVGVNSMTLGSDVSISAAGWGGAGDAQAGIGAGGNANLGAGDGSSLTVAADTEVDASGFGGYGFDTTNGGLGRGGTAGIGTFGTAGSSIDLTGPVFVTSNGQGGDGLNGGIGTGGIAYISAVLGTVHAFNSVLVGANSDGGFANSASGTGGAGLADIETTVTPDMTEAALFASGGTLIVDGLTTVAANATGGDGGFNGGDGGDAVAAGIAGVTDGGAAIHAANSDAGPSVIQLGDVVITAEAQGGQGSDGQSGTNGSDGGNGGSATGGKAVITAAAGSGDITAGVTTLSASATGGDGGSGGSGDGGSGGNGGSGGSATGGFINAGTESGNTNFAQGANNGTASYASIVALTTATGGNGGNAGFGSPAGIAGNGGEAFGGQAVLLVRGSEVTVGDVNLVASATGGDGGLDEFGALQGNGGDAVTGFVGVVVTNRFQLPGQRGTLNAGAISGSAIATGGTGAVNGGQWTLGGSTFFQLVGADASFDSLNLIAQADGIDPDATETNASFVEIVGGTVTVTGQFDIETPGRISILADNGTLSALLFDITADNFVHDENRPAPASPGTISADNIFLTTGQDLIVDAQLVSLNGVGFTAPGLIDVDNVTSTNGSVALTAGTTLTAGDLAAANGNVVVQSNGNMVLADVAAGGDVLLDSGASMTLGNVTAQTGSVQASAVDVLTFGSITAGTFVTIDPTAIIGGDITALAGDVTATGDSIDIGNVTASDNVFLTALAGDLSTLDISAGIDVALDATGAITTGDVTAAGNVTAGAGGQLTMGNLAGQVIDLDAGTGINAGNVDATQLLANTLTGNLSFGDITTLAALSLGAPGSILTGDVDSGDIIVMNAGTSLIFGDLNAIAGINLQAGTSMSGGNVITGAGFEADALGGSMTLGNVDAVSFLVMHAAGNVTTGNLDSGTGNVWADAQAGSTSVGNVSGGSVDLTATGAVNAGDVQSSIGWVYVRADGGPLTIGNVDAASFANLDAAGDIAFGNVAADDFDFDSTNGSVTGGNIVAGTKASGSAAGAVILGDITVGPGLPLDDDFSVGFSSATSITVGDVSGAGHVGFATLGDLTTGSISAGDLVMTLVGGDISTGSITTTNAGGRVYMADASMFIDAGGGEDNFDASLVLALDPVPTGGSITINGPVSTGLFQAAAGSGLTTGAIAATTIEASAGGTVTLNGIWSAQDVTLASNDIDITGSGGISGNASGLVTLISTNATQALIGDGLTGSGYALSNAEFGRIEGGSVYILARGDASAAQDMLIGDLTVTGPTAGSTIENSEGILVFATGDTATQAPGGVIRVVGDVSATGFGSSNAMEFYADLFELDAAAGSISITSSGTTLGGELGLYADQIHVAEGSILDQLALDPQYSGYQQDLNAPAAVQRPEGVLNAGVIWIESDNLQNVLIQNTGTAETPAGFLANLIFLNEDFDVAGPPGSIDLVVNGQLITEAGTLIGVAVRDVLVAGADLTPFTANSTINNCLLSGACGAIEPPFPPGFTPTPGIQQEIVLINDNLLPPPEFENENFIDDNDETTEEGDTSPIEPPQPLFDTSGLGDKGDVDDPVSGSGNPALMETTPPSANQEKQP